MISIIVCSRNEVISTDFVQNIDETVGVVYEIIHINNSKNKYSICSADNEGCGRAQYSSLCFVHDDVYFRSKNWGQKVLNHLQTPNIGILGLAGRDFLTRVPASWTAKMDGINIIQSDKTGQKSTKEKVSPAGYNKPRRSVIMLDGVFLCMKRDLMKEIKFDEEIGGFHAYDFDISIQATLAGKNNCVIYDIKLEHFSRGTPDADYYRNLIRVFKKWEMHLPLIGDNIDDYSKSTIATFEKKGISRLTKKLIRRGFTTQEIVAEKKHFRTVIGIKNSNIVMEYAQVYFLKLINYPNHILTTIKTIYYS